jgi:hypothetical protein
VLEIVRHLPIMMSVGLVAWAVFRARALDPHSRSELRDVLWPEFARHRRLVTAGFCALVSALAVASAAPWWLSGPLSAFLAQSLAGCLAAYLSAGVLMLMPRLEAVCSRGRPKDEPGAAALLYVVSWPLWVGTTRRLVRRT